MEMKQDKNIWRVYLAASCQDNTNLHCNEDSCVCEWTAGFSFVPEPQVLSDSADVFFSLTVIILKSQATTEAFTAYDGKSPTSPQGCF